MQRGDDRAWRDAGTQAVADGGAPYRRRTGRTEKRRCGPRARRAWGDTAAGTHRGPHRSEEQTSELQSIMRLSYAVFCLKKKKLKIITFIHPRVHLTHVHSALCIPN